MKYFAIALSLYATATLANPLSVQVNNFNFQYSQPHGEGSATSLTINDKTANEPKVNISKNGLEFDLVFDGDETQELTLANPPSFMLEAESMNISGFNLNLSDKFTLGLSQGQFDSRKDSLRLNNLSVDCSRNLVLEEVTDQVLAGCISRMIFKTSKLSTGDVTVQSFDLKSSNGKYDLSADVKAQINGKVKSNGQLSYDASTGLLTVKITEVKLSILNVTNQVFDELKKNESEKFKVKKPYLYIQLK